MSCLLRSFAIRIRLGMLRENEQARVSSTTLSSMTAIMALHSSPLSKVDQHWSDHDLEPSLHPRPKFPSITLEAIV